jgi:type III pantothenate kinase
MTAAESLVRNTAQLPRIDILAPPGPIGDDTASAMQAGVVLGYVSLVEGLLARIQAALPGSQPAPVVATGGLAGPLLPLIRPEIRHDPALTLHGLRLIHARNP